MTITNNDALITLAMGLSEFPVHARLDALAGRCRNSYGPLMSSDLYSVKVRDVAETSAKLEVRALQRDGGAPKGDATFALQLVYEPISSLSSKRGYKHLGTCPLAQVIDQTNLSDEGWVRANARAFIAKSKYVAGVLELQPTHPAWIQHLRAGMVWETTAYPMGPGDKVAPQMPEAAPEPASIADPMAGFRLCKKPKSTWVRRQVIVPIFGPARYYADPVLSKPAEMAEGVAKLLGQPLYLVPKKGPPKVAGYGKMNDPRTLYLYSDNEFGCMGEPVSLTELKSFGRAWLKGHGPQPQTSKPRARR